MIKVNKENPVKVLELFGGIGACTQAFKRLGIPHKVVDYVEIDKYAVKSYNSINQTNFEPQDIQDWDKDIEVDFIMHGSPCQDFSVAGLGKSADINAVGETRSSLMYETVRIVNKLRPKVVLWENVKNVLSKKHKANFDNYINALEEMGYTNYWKVLNTKEYGGVPQNRERLFVLSVLGDESFEFPKPIELEMMLKDVLEADVEEKYYITSDKAKALIDNLIVDGKLNPKEYQVGVDLCSKQAKLKSTANCIKARYDSGITNFKDDNTGGVRG